MSWSYILGVILGFIIGVALVMVLLKYVKKDGGIKCRYDERQELIRGRSFRIGFYTMIICMALDTCFGELTEIFMERSVLIFLCMCIGIMAQAGYAIWHDGYFSLNEYPGRAVLAFAGLALFNLLIAARSIHEGELIKNGVLTFSSLNLICAILLFIVILLVLARNVYRKRQDEG